MGLVWFFKLVSSFLQQTRGQVLLYFVTETFKGPPVPPTDSQPQAAEQKQACSII